MKFQRTAVLLTALSVGAFCVLSLKAAEAPEKGNEKKDPGKSRTIRLLQDDAQVRFESKIYELSKASAQEILPFVLSAVKRYHVNSAVSIITDGTKRQAILVSTGREFLPYVDAVVAALDRPGKSTGEGSGISGTGLVRIAYAPSYRGAPQFASIIDTVLSSGAGKAYVDSDSNTIFWRDQRKAAENTLSWLTRLDRPLPQVSIRLNYYELRDSDLKDWGLDYLAWKNGPGVNLLNVGYNAGRIAVNELLKGAADWAQFAGYGTWGIGGFFTAPSFDMSFVRCLQQSGNANVTAHASLTMLNTPVATEDDYIKLLQQQYKNPDRAQTLYRVSMTPEYQNISKNVLGRSLIGKSYYEDDKGEKHGDPPVLEAKFLNPFVCFEIGQKDEDRDGFIPSNPEFYAKPNRLRDNGGVIFDYSLSFKGIVERGNTGSELNNSTVFTGSATLGFGLEKVLAVYEKENDVEQTMGLPVLCRIPILKYLFSTVTTIKERTYIIVTAEAELVHPDSATGLKPVSESIGIKRRIENPFKADNEGSK